MANSILTTATVASSLIMANTGPVLVAESNSEYDLNSLFNSESSISRADVGYSGNVYQFSPLSLLSEEPVENDFDEFKEVVSINDMVSKVRGVFGLNNVQIAQVLGISRPSLYNHIKVKELPQSIETYDELYSLAVDVEKDVGRDIRKGLKTVLVEGKTLLSYLKADRIDKEKVLEVCHLVAEKLSNAQGANELKSDIDGQRSSSRGVGNLG